MDRHTDSHSDPHRSTVVAAEVRRLQRRLLAIGPMPKQQLARECGAEHWREGTLEEAICEGERQGLLRRLPLGWVEATPRAADSRPL